MTALEKKYVVRRIDEATEEKCSQVAVELRENAGLKTPYFDSGEYLSERAGILRKALSPALKKTGAREKPGKGYWSSKDPFRSLAGELDWPEDRAKIKLFKEVNEKGAKIVLRWQLLARSVKDQVMLGDSKAAAKALASFVDMAVLDPKDIVITLK